MKKIVALLFILALAGFTACDWVSPSEPNVHASFTPLKEPGSTTVRFRNESTGASHYLWNFGNGATSTLFEPEVLYGGFGGTFLVSLRACPGGNMESNKCSVAEQFVTVP